MQKLCNSPGLAGSATPSLEGAPCSRSHEDRGRPLISPAPNPEKTGKEGSPSKP